MTLRTIPLRAVKALHTIIWTFFESCVFAIPFFAWVGRLDAALLFTAIVWIEVLVLVFNAWRCPLTAVAARYTSDRRDNFDIYLPAWLARHNKSIFGTLFVGGMLLTAVRWLG